GLLALLPVVRLDRRPGHPFETTAARRGVGRSSTPRRRHVMPLLRKKPVVIKAMRWDPGDAKASTALTLWVQQNGGDVAIVLHEDHGLRVARLEVRTLEGVMEAQPGDWIIRGVQGEFYPCKPDIF